MKQKHVFFQTVRRQINKGFTLLEILIAIFIFAILAVTIYGSYNSFFTSAQAIDKSSFDYEMAQNCLNRIVVDLQSIYLTLPPVYYNPDFDDPPDPCRITGYMLSSGDNEFARLRFTSLAHIFFGKNRQTGIAEIVYYVNQASDNNYVLQRSDTLYPYQPFVEKRSDPVLCERIQSFIIKFYDNDGAEYDYWDSDSDDFKYTTPKAISIKLEVGAELNPVLLETMVSLPVYREKKE